MPDPLPETSSRSTRPVALFLPSLAGGGAERAVLDAARTLAADGMVVHLVVASAQGTYRSEVPANVTLIDLACSRTAFAAWPLARYLSRVNPQTLLAALTHANVVAVAAKQLSGWKGRLVVSERNTLSSAWSRWSPQRQRLQAIALAACYRRADVVATVSKGVADDLVRLLGLEPSHVHVLYNASASPRLEQLALASLDDPWFAPGSPPVFLAVGRLDRQKDFETLLHALHVARSQPSVPIALRPRLVVLGEGPERAALEAQSEALGLREHVRFPGFADNPFAWMSRVHAFVLSSRFEGLPNVLIQALTVGCPAISTRCPSGPEEILADGRYGVLVPVGDQTALGLAIAAACVQPRAAVDPNAVAPFRPEAVRLQLREVLSLD